MRQAQRRWQAAYGLASFGVAVRPGTSLCLCMGGVPGTLRHLRRTSLRYRDGRTAASAWSRRAPNTMVLSLLPCLLTVTRATTGPRSEKYGLVLDRKSAPFCPRYRAGSLQQDSALPGTTPVRAQDGAPPRVHGRFPWKLGRKPAAEVVLCGDDRAILLLLAKQYTRSWVVILGPEAFLPHGRLWRYL